jgi:lipoate-protein ligase B
MIAWSLTFSEPVGYAEALAFQHRLLTARQRNEIPDTILLLEHLPVVTIGNRGREEYLLKTRDEYAQMGIELFQAERGGDVTFHGPGQWVLYPILHLGGQEADAHGYLYNLEQTAIHTLESFGVEGYRREGKSGAWTQAGKIAAIGFRLKKWVSFHGMSFNVNNALSGFETIVPCGLSGEPVTTLEAILQEKTPSKERVGDRLLSAFEEVHGRRLIRYHIRDTLPEELAVLQPPQGG